MPKHRVKPKNDKNEWKQERMWNYFYTPNQNWTLLALAGFRNGQKYVFVLIFSECLRLSNILLYHINQYWGASVHLAPFKFRLYYSATINRKTALILSWKILYNGRLNLQEISSLEMLKYQRKNVNKLLLFRFVLKFLS